MSIALTDAIVVMRAVAKAAANLRTMTTPRELLGANFDCSLKPRRGRTFWHQGHC